MSQNQLSSAHEIFSKAIELDPDWAEAWNKRATVLYLMGDYELSQNDINIVLSLEKDILEHCLAKVLFNQL